MPDSTPQPHSNPLGLGIDAGGTQTRWALADVHGVLHAQGTLPALSGLQLASEAGRSQIAAALHDLAAQVCVHRPRTVLAGVTGFSANDSANDSSNDSTTGSAKDGPDKSTNDSTNDSTTLQRMLADALALAPQQVRAMSDIELLCHGAFEPGAGCVVYAGTGSIAAFADAQGSLHRGGGRGAVIDDAGGGHWIARQALQHIWRGEDAAPGSSAQSALAQRVSAHIGGSGWAATRAWVYTGPGSARGGLGLLALAVAQAARDDGDAQALRILQDAGAELARLARALLQRHGPLPVALAGRVFDLHPAIQASLRAALPPGQAVQRLAQSAHHAAAQRAARWAAATDDRTDA